MNAHKESYSLYHAFMSAFHKNRVASLALKFFIGLILVGIYAPLFASSKPILVKWNGEHFSPMLRYLWFRGYYTKPVDLFFNVLMVFLPLMFLAKKFIKKRMRFWTIFLLIIMQLSCFGYVYYVGIKDPVCDDKLKKIRSTKLRSTTFLDDAGEEIVLFIPKNQRTWDMEKRFMNSYEQLSLLIRNIQRQKEDHRLQKYLVNLADKKDIKLSTLRQLEMKSEQSCLIGLQKRLESIHPHYEEKMALWKSAIEDYKPSLMALNRLEHELTVANYHNQQDKVSWLNQEFQFIKKESSLQREHLLKAKDVLEDYIKIGSAISFIQDKRSWINKESEKITLFIPPLLSQFHWEEDAGGSKDMNKYVPWWELTRMTRKSMIASLIFGIRTALVVGGVGIILSLFIGVSIGLIAGYFGGRIDLIFSRFIEIWEAMPMLFILMLIVSITQIKSLFLSAVILGCFGWTGISRYTRVETLKQREMPYVLAAKSLGYSCFHIMFHQILANAIIPVITLIPFVMMSMISSEAGLTFLGLGEESSPSWGSMMREGVSAFPSESRTLWPPAVMLTLLLIAIAIIGDGVRDAMDPKLQD